MMTPKDAIALARDYADRECPGQVVLEDTLLDHGHCFSVIINSEEYSRTRRVHDLLIGCGPLIIDKSSGETYGTGSAHNTEYYVRNLKNGGHPYAQPSNHILLRGSGKVDTMAVSRVLKRILECPSAESLKKARTLESCDIDVEAPSVEAARQLLQDLERLGVRGEFVWKVKRP